MNAEEIAAILCRRWEGLYRGPYLCPAGVPTIGYGATYYPNGVRVTLHDPVLSVAECEALLIWHIRCVYLPTVLKLCPGLANEEPRRLAAIIDWTFNLGGRALGASTLRRKINAGDWDAVPAEIRKWVMAGGKPLRGLINRRAAEVRLWEV